MRALVYCATVCVLTACFVSSCKPVKSGGARVAELPSNDEAKKFFGDPLNLLLLNIFEKLDVERGKTTVFDARVLFGIEKVDCGLADGLPARGGTEGPKGTLDAGALEKDQLTEFANLFARPPSTDVGVPGQWIAGKLLADLDRLKRREVDIEPWLRALITSQESFDAFFRLPRVEQLQVVRKTIADYFFEVNYIQRSALALLESVTAVNVVLGNIPPMGGPSLGAFRTVFPLLPYARYWIDGIDDPKMHKKGLKDCKEMDPDEGDAFEDVFNRTVDSVRLVMFERYMVASLQDDLYILGQPYVEEKGLFGKLVQKFLNPPPPVYKAHPELFGELSKDIKELLPAPRTVAAARLPADDPVHYAKAAVKVRAKLTKVMDVDAAAGRVARADTAWLNTPRLAPYLDWTKLIVSNSPYSTELPGSMAGKGEQRRLIGRSKSIPAEEFDRLLKGKPRERRKDFLSSLRDDLRRQFELDRFGLLELLQEHYQALQCLNDPSRGEGCFHLVHEVLGKVVADRSFDEVAFDLGFTLSLSSINRRLGGEAPKDDAALLVTQLKAGEAAMMSSMCRYERRKANARIIHDETMTGINIGLLVASSGVSYAYGGFGWFRAVHPELKFLSNVERYIDIAVKAEELTPELAVGTKALVAGLRTPIMERISRAMFLSDLVLNPAGDVIQGFAECDREYFHAVKRFNEKLEEFYRERPKGISTVEIEPVCLNGSPLYGEPNNRQAVNLVFVPRYYECLKDKLWLSMALTGVSVLPNLPKVKTHYSK